VESQLLRQGLAAERQGRTADAISALSQLVTEYPHSPLAPDARAALARIQAGVR
jgi:outer membrane protein assembly factor BamD (BamD/ComL family)